MRKFALFTDIHFGRKNNDPAHNQDCLDYLEWFVATVNKIKDIDAVIFLGDWHQFRNSMHIKTMDYSYRGIKLLSALGLPIYFLLGNHDLYYKESREISSVVYFQDIENIHIISEPTVVDNSPKPFLLCPYITTGESELLKKYTKIPYWFGHFEFNGFKLNSGGHEAKNSIDIGIAKKPKKIFSGHFHMRQELKNIIYIGNAFPMDFGDAGDKERGMCIVDVIDDTHEFINWIDAPSYINLKYSEIMEDPPKIDKKARVRCVLDVQLSYEERNLLRETVFSDDKLREVVFEETDEITKALAETDASMDDERALLPTDELVEVLLSEIEVDDIDSSVLVTIYKQLREKDD